MHEHLQGRRQLDTEAAHFLFFCEGVCRKNEQTDDASASDLLEEDKQHYTKLANAEEIAIFPAPFHNGMAKN